MSKEISEVTRRSIIDHFTAGNISWSGRLSEDEFLARLYDLNSLPSNDHRYGNAAGDIYQHCVRNNDWSVDWVFYDSRFNLMHADDEQFLKFLCETVHPVIQKIDDEARALVDFYNRELAKDGWQLVKTKQISGRPVFSAYKG
jgi:hypothetical protein